MSLGNSNNSNGELYCPICAHRAYVIETVGSRPSYMVRCGSSACEVSTPQLLEREGAIRRWQGFSHTLARRLCDFPSLAESH